MRVPLGYKFILGFLVVVGAVAFVPTMVDRLGYSPEASSFLTYLIALTIGLILGSVFSRRFTRNISNLTEAADGISRGDLTRRAEISAGRFPDESSELAVSINLMAQNLLELVSRIKATSIDVSDSANTLSNSAIEINASSEEVVKSIEQISHGAETQAEMVEKTSKLIKEMAVSIELVAARARETSRAAKETTQTARKGGDLAGDSLERMKDFLGLVEVSGRKFLQFHSRLQQVEKIADVIGDIARQTNLLALNASIEAARAGEAGKAFGVVADEVRKLADGTAKSASDIAEVIAAVREESRKVHETIVESSRRIEEAKNNIDLTASAFNEIVTNVVETERRANTIADLSQMQTEGAEKMVSAVDEIARVAEDNAAATEEVSAATEEQAAGMHEMALAARDMAALADGLLEVVKGFRTVAEESLDEQPPASV